MICTQDIDRQYYPEIGDRDVEVSRDRQLVINLMRWFALEVLGLIKRPVRLLSFLLIFWPVILYG